MVLSIYMPKDDALNATAKKLEAKYSVTKKMWHLPYSKESVNKAFEAFKQMAWVDYSALQQKEKGGNEKRESDSPANYQ